MNKLDQVAVALVPYRVDPKVTPNWDFFPPMQWLQNLVGAGVALALLLLVGVAVLGAVAWAVSKSGNMQRAQNVSAVVMFGAFIAAVFVGSASAIVKWSAGQNLGF